METIYKGDIFNLGNNNGVENQVVSVIKSEVHQGRPRYFYSVYPYFNYTFDVDFEKHLAEYEAFCNGTASEEVKRRLLTTHLGLRKKNAEYLGTEILYKKIFGEDGLEYGKELLTNRIFPIVSNKESNYDISGSKGDNDRVLFDDSEVPRAYKLAVSSDGYHCVRNIWTNRCRTISDYDYDRLNRGLPSNTSISASLRFESGHISLSEQEVQVFNITLKSKILFPSDQRIEYAVTNEKVANAMELKEYLEKGKPGFFQRKKSERFINSIIEYSSSNYLGHNQFTETKPIKERLVESPITQEMEQLEFLLAKLRSVSIDDYNKLNDEYQAMISGDNKVGLSVSPLALPTLVSLQNKVEFAFLCHGGDSKRILAYLNNQVGNYIDNYKNNNQEKTKLTIDELDNISEQLLKNRNDYTPTEQNEILRNLAILYFFEIHENKDTITGRDLENSYIADNIKRIITVISTLKDIGIIKEIPSNIYDVDNTDDLLEIIVNTEFVARDQLLEETSELVSKIQR